ncbi:ChaN family lipoprotein [Pseudomonadota bacterium]
MNRLRMLAVAGLSATLTVFAGAALSDTSKTVTSAAKVAPLTDLYDTIWVKSEDGSVKSLEQVADDLSQFDVVFFGEFHGHSGIHLKQMQIFAALQQRNPNMTLSLEQFERDTQPLVDLYLAGKIGEKVLQEDGRAWPNYEQSYRPLVEFSKDNDLPVVASNAPKQAVICVSKKGPEIIDEIPMPDRLWVAKELHIEEGAYLDKYRSFIENSSTHGPNKDLDDTNKNENCVDIDAYGASHGAHSDTDPTDSMVAGMAEKKDHMAAGSADKKEQMTATGTDKKEPDAGASMEADKDMEKIMQAMIMKSFSSQVLRDDTMAESIAMHLQDNPGRKVLHLDGNFHSASHLGTVERLKLRMPELKIAVINPIAVGDNNAPAWTDEDLSTGDYILLVREVPEMFICKSRELEFQRKTIKKRMGNKCVYSEETAQQEK